MKKVTWLSLATLLFFSLPVLPCMAKTTWNANVAWPPNNHHSIGMVQFSEKIKTLTNGELDIVVQCGGALGYKGPELLKVVRDGLVPISDIFIGGVAGEAKIFQVTTLPFLIQNMSEAKLLSEIARPYFDKTATKWKQKILYIAPWPSTGLWTMKEVQSAADMKGLKIRTYDKNCAMVVDAAQATPYALPFSEVYSSLATGLINSVITSTSTAVDGKFWEVLKYYQRLNMTVATNMVTVNLRKFNKLDKKTQQILIDTGKEMEKIMWKRVAELDKEKEAVCNGKGIKSVPVSQAFLAELSKLSDGIHQEWKKNAPADAIKIYNAFLQKVGR